MTVQVTWTEGHLAVPRYGHRRSQALHCFAAPGATRSPPETARKGGFGARQEENLLLVQTDHLPGRAKQGTALEEVIGCGFHLEDQARSLPRRDVDQVGGGEEANLPA